MKQKEHILQTRIQTWLDMMTQKMFFLTSVFILWRRANSNSWVLTSPTIDSISTINTHNKSDITKCIIFIISLKKKTSTCTEHEFPCLHSMLQPLFITITPSKILRKKSYFMSAISPFYIIIFQHQDHGWKVWTKHMYHDWICCHFYEFSLLLHF